MLEEIRKRLEEYREHCSDSYSYDLGEIDAVRNMRSHAPEDIEFLLGEIEILSYDPFSPAEPDPEFYRRVRKEFEENNSFREWMQSMDLAEKYLE